MNDLPISNLGSILTLLGTGGGVWIVLRLIRAFQRDFSDEYRRELDVLRDRESQLRRDFDRFREDSHKQHVETTAALARCEQREARLMNVLIRNGIRDDGQ